MAPQLEVRMRVLSLQEAIPELELEPEWKPEDNGP